MEFRIDFKKFAGLDLDQAPPDATTFVVFRERIQSLWSKLLRRLNAQLDQAGYAVKKAIAVDATLVEAYSKPRKDDDEHREIVTELGAVRSPLLCRDSCPQNPTFLRKIDPPRHSARVGII